MRHVPRLARLTGNDGYGTVVRDDVQAVAGTLASLSGPFGASLALAVREHIDPSPHVVVAGKDAAALAGAARSLSVAGRTVLVVEDVEDAGVPKEARALARAAGKRPMAVVCVGRACRAASTPDELTVAAR